MVKKILVTITCGLVAVSMCACASGAVVLEQAQNIVGENLGEVESFLTDDLGAILAPSEEEAAAGTVIQASEAGEDVTEEAASVEETIPAEETETAAEATLEETTTAEETVAAEPDTTAEPVTEEETKVLLNDAEEEPATVVNDSEEETKVALQDAKEETTTAFSDSNGETTAADDVSAAETEEAKQDATDKPDSALITPETEPVEEIALVLQKDQATADGKTVTTSAAQGVYISDDILYYEDLEKYESGNPYGEGTLKERHTAEEAAQNPVLNITKAGTYRLSGEWNGQIRIDLGEDARTDKDAKVTLVLDNADVTCTVAPAIVFDNVYECDAQLADDQTEDSQDAKTDEDLSDEDLEAFFEDLFHSLNSKENKEQAETGEKKADRVTEETPALSGGSEDDFTEEELYELFSALFGADGSYNDAAAEDSAYATDAGDDLTAEEKETASSIFSTKPDTQEQTKPDAAEQLKPDPDAKPETDETAKPDAADAQKEASVQQEIDTADAGAAIVIAKDSSNTITGSHVAKIYKDSKDEEKLVKQDGALYSYVTLTIEAEEETSGELNIIGDNEGLDTERHLSINSGKINIISVDDGINTNEDDVSVTEINGGELHILAGTGTEGDAIDSNGWIVINGGTVIVSANPASDSGLDSDRGSYINGGTVLAFGSDMDLAAADSKAVTMNLKFAAEQTIKEGIRITDTRNKTIYELKVKEDVMLSTLATKCKGLVISTPELKKGETYYLYIDGVQQTNTGTEVLPQRPEFGPGIGPSGTDSGSVKPDEAAGDNAAAKPDSVFGSSNNTTTAKPDAADDNTDSVADADDFDIDYSQWADLFRYFGISEKDLEDYLDDVAGADDNQNNSAQNPFGGNQNSQNDPAQNPFGGPQGNGAFGGSQGDRPDKPQGQPGNPFGTTQTAAEPATEFTLDQTVTTFTGVAAAETEEADKDAASATDKDTANENETTTATDEKETTVGTEDNNTSFEENGKDNTSVTDPQKDADKGFSLPFNLSQKEGFGLKGLAPEGNLRISANEELPVIALEEPEDLANFYQMFRARLH